MPSNLCSGTRGELVCQLYSSWRISAYSVLLDGVGTGFFDEDLAADDVSHGKLGINPTCPSWWSVGSSVSLSSWACLVFLLLCFLTEEEFLSTESSSSNKLMTGPRRLRIRLDLDMTQSHVLLRMKRLFRQTMNETMIELKQIKRRIVENNDNKSTPNKSNAEPRWT